MLLYFLRGIGTISWCDREMPSSKSPSSIPQGVLEAWQEVPKVGSSQGAVGGVGRARLCRQV